jgi:HAD superfamily hydrolase (TIGR01450 family)
MLDLDGVVYLGPTAVPGAADALNAARAAGMRLAYLTNNASRTAGDVATHLRELGMPELSDSDVVTSAQAVARLMAADLPPGAAVLLIGGSGLQIPLEENGLRCVDSLDDEPVAVVQGFHADLGWRDLAEAAYAVGSGLPWYASNTDMTVPTPRGVAPGNGSLVQAVANATGRTPIVAGKPESPLFDATTARLGGDRPLMVGDRLDTDIDGAIGAGIASLAVLTGVSTLAAIFAAGPGHRPDYVSHDLAGLGEIHPPVHVADGVARCGAATATLNDRDVIDIAGAEPQTTDALRAAVQLAWTTRDTSNRCALPGGTLDA